MKKVDKLNFMKIKDLLCIKDTINTVKGNPQRLWEKIFANYVSEKRLIFRIHKELLNSTITQLDYETGQKNV